MLTVDTGTSPSLVQFRRGPARVSTFCLQCWILRNVDTTMFPSTALCVLTAVVECSASVLFRPSSESLLLRVIRSQQTVGRPLPDETDPVRINSLRVDSRVSSRYAYTVVTSSVTNPTNDSQQIKLSVLLPEAAFITGFTLKVGEKVYRSFMKEKQEAKYQYQTALYSGLTAGHLAVSARDSNHFYISVNVEAYGRASFNLTYEQLLSRTLGLYNHVINLHPGQVVPDLAVTVEVSESHPLTKLSVLPFNTKGQVDSYGENSVWEEVKVERLTEKKALIIFTPSIATQNKLSLVEGEGLSGQLIVRYDVENQPPGGSILVNEGYFVHFVSPGNLSPLRKHAIFTLDVSGSMTGRKLEQLKEAMVRILDDLDPEDFFNIIEFSYAVTVWNLDSLSSSAVIQPEIHTTGLWWFNKAELPSTPSPPSVSPPTSSPLHNSVPPYPATSLYIQKAKDVIEKMTAGGGTNIHGALKTAMLAAAASFINTTANTTKPKPEPIVIFLTDGDPTIGITDHNKILSMVKDLNVKQSAIFSLAFGDGADLSFLRRLSLANNGFARNIYEASDVALQLQNFYREVASPLLANVTFSYLPGQVVRSSLTSQNFHSLFLGSQLVVAGRLNKTTQISANVTGLAANGSTTYRVQSEAQPIDDLSASLYGVESSEEENEDESRDDAKDKKLKRKKKARGTLERLWAYLTIQQLLDRRQVLETEDVKKRVLELALRYNFVTPVTSLVVVKPNQSVEIDQESLKPQSLLNRLYPNSNMHQNIHPSPTRVKYEGTSSFMEESTTNKLYTMERLQNLKLGDLTWLEGLVDWENGAVTLPLGVNGTNQQYRLGLDQEDQPLGDCASPRGKMGQCRHLPHCVLPDILSSVTNYIRYYCPLPSGFAGICCPDLHRVTTTERIQTTTGDTDFTTTELFDMTESPSQV